MAELPAYYEPKFGSMIELLQFHSPNPKYVAKLDKLRTETLNIPVICAANSVVNNAYLPQRGYTGLRVDHPSLAGAMEPMSAVQ